MNESKVAQANEVTSEAPESGKHPVSAQSPDQIADKLERWFRELRDTADELALCVDDALKDDAPLGIAEVQHAAMIDAMRCHLEFDYWVNQVRNLQGKEEPSGATVATLEAVVLKRRLALAELIDSEVAGKLASLAGARGSRFAAALDAVNDAVDALREAEKAVAS